MVQRGAGALQQPLAAGPFARRRLGVATQAIAPLGRFGVKGLRNLVLIEQFGADDLALQRRDQLAMGQGRDGVQAFGAFDLVSYRLGHHAPAAHKDELFQPVLALQLGDFVRHRRGVLGVAGQDFDAHRTTLGTAE